jgi:hypothetical protein
MAEPTTAVNLPVTPGVVASPPTFGATSIAVTIAAAEILVTLGQSRHLLDPQTEQPSGRVDVEWFGSYSFSPPAAQQLHMALAEALRVYETKYGKISHDPNAVVRGRPVGAKRGY